MIRGFDASAAQGFIPWGQFDSSYRFAILKAQQGNDGFDPTFGRNAKGARKAGIEPFAYCFAYPLPPEAGHFGRDPREQARLFVDRVCAADTSMHGRPLFLDLEWPPPQEWGKWNCTAEQISSWCADCADEVANYTGVPPVLYTYPDWWAHVSKADVSWAAQYPLWLASYVVKGWPQDGQSPRVPAPWDDWLFWQFDGNGGLRLPNGVDADFCVFNGDEAALAALIHTA